MLKVSHVLCVWGRCTRANRGCAAARMLSRRCRHVSILNRDNVWFQRVACHKGEVSRYAPTSDAPSVRSRCTQPVHLSHGVRQAHPRPGPATVAVPPCDERAKHSGAPLAVQPRPPLLRRPRPQTPCALLHLVCGSVPCALLCAGSRQQIYHRCTT